MVTPDPPLPPPPPKPAAASSRACCHSHRVAHLQESRKTSPGRRSESCAALALALALACLLLLSYVMPHLRPTARSPADCHSLPAVVLLLLLVLSFLLRSLSAPFFRYERTPSAPPHSGFSGETIGYQTAPMNPLFFFSFKVFFWIFSFTLSRSIRSSSRPLSSPSSSSSASIITKSKRKPSSAAPRRRCSVPFC